MSSPFLKTQQHVNRDGSLETTLLPSPFKGSMATMATQSTTVALPISEQNIEALGGNIARMVAGVANRFTQLNTEKLTADYGDLGDILTTASMEADKLDPANIFPKGVVGWVRGKMFSVRHTLLKHLRSADDSFTALESVIAKRIAIDEKWIRDFDSLYTDNLSAYNEIMSEITTARNWERSIQNIISNLPAIDPADPDGIMKAQAYRVAEGRLQRLRAKIDSFLRLKTLAENNGPKIHGMQEASRSCVQSLGDVLTQVLPFVKMDFTLYIAALDSKKSVDMVSKSRNLADATLLRTADAVGDAMVGSARMATSASISNETLVNIRTKMLDAVTQVRQIHRQADVQRQADSKMIQETQEAYLANLTAQGAI